MIQHIFTESLWILLENKLKEGESKIRQQLRGFGNYLNTSMMVKFTKYLLLKVFSFLSFYRSLINTAFTWLLDLQGFESTAASTSHSCIHFTGAAASRSFSCLPSTPIPPSSTPSQLFMFLIICFLSYTNILLFDFGYYLVASYHGTGRFSFLTSPLQTHYTQIQFSLAHSINIVRFG